MQLLQLRYFLTVAKLQHMSEAALELNISQSSLSRTIYRLEEQVGVQLFNRRGRHIELNEYGKIFQEKISKALQLINEGVNEVNNKANLNRDYINLGIPNSKILPGLINEFYKKRPDIRINQFLLNNMDMEKLLESNKIDLCIIAMQFNSNSIEWTPLFEEELYMIVPKKHRFAKRKEISLAEAANEKFIQFKKGFNFRNITEKLCMKAGFSQNIVFEGEELSAILQLVNEGLGISFWPAYAEEYIDLSNTTRISVVNPICRRTVGIAWNKNNVNTFATDVFKAFALEYLENHIIKKSV